MSATSNGGSLRPGSTWSDPDEREVFFPGSSGSIRSNCSHPTLREVLADLLSQVECCDGTAQISIEAAERALAEDLQPDPIALSERLPGDDDVLKAGPYSFAWLGRELRSGHWHWEWTDVCFAPNYTHWLPASVRYLPARA